MSVWREWLQHPEKNRVRNAFFHAHLLAGAVAGVYVVLMSLSGSMIIYRAETEKAFPSSRAAMEWLVKLHGSLLLGSNGRFVNGIGSLCLTVLAITGAVIWWPGIGDWRRALTVNWKAHFGRISWDAHSALGFWCFPFVLMWGISSLYFAFPAPFYLLSNLIDPRDRFTDAALAALSALHFGRFNGFTQMLWTFLGLVPAVLSVTGVFLCCRRMIYKIPAKQAMEPRQQRDGVAVKQETAGRQI
jgi:uncharacterized iron-regulated membrane protein